MSDQDKSIKSLATTCRVFISYSHDSKEHEQRALSLADRLRGDGIEAWIDQYVQDPEEGWIKWMRTQVKQADKVLLVFTKTYQERFEGDEEEGKGLGATFEGVIVTQALYDGGGRNSRFRAVVFHEEDLQFIPLELRRFNRYGVDSPEHYENLIRWLHGAPRVVVPIVGQKPDLPPKPTPILFSGKPDETRVHPHSDKSDPRNARHHRGLWAGLIVAISSIVLGAFMTPPLNTFSLHFWNSAQKNNTIGSPSPGNAISKPSKTPERPAEGTPSAQHIHTNVGVATVSNPLTYSDGDHIQAKVLSGLKEAAPQIDFLATLDTPDLSRQDFFDKVYLGDVSVLQESGALSQIDYLLLFKIKALAAPNPKDQRLVTCRLVLDFRLFDKNGRSVNQGTFDMFGTESTEEMALDQAIERVIKKYSSQVLNGIVADSK